MSHIRDYRLDGDGTLWVHVSDGATRKATASEWLAVWRADPCLTLRLTLGSAACR